MTSVRSLQQRLSGNETILEGRRLKGKIEENVEAKGLSMSRNESFENLVVWKKGMDLVVKVYRLCQQSPLSKDWGMRDQLQRAAVSIPANIAEGYERGGRKEYIRFLGISKGSAGELR